MRIVLLTRAFQQGMGYLENMLPKYLARAGVETHVVAMDLPPYYWLPEFAETYGEFSQPHSAGSVEGQDGYTLHILGHRKIAGYMRMVGLQEKLASIRPDIVQTSVCIGWIALDAARYKAGLGYRLFTGNHYHASVFPLATRSSSWWEVERLRCTLTRYFPGWLASLPAEKCYAIAPDCADVASRFFGVPETKIAISPLGVDTDIFIPVTSEKDQQARQTLRQQLGFSDSDIVCIYTGRFSEDKNPLLLAQAVAQLAADGKPYRGLFMGQGRQGAAIGSSTGCTVHPFVPVQELGNFFRAANIGVWPTQESLSMLDAAGCGLPIVANDTVSVLERIEGNGLLYKLNDVHDLVRTLLELRDQNTRQQMGFAGAAKVASKFSWSAVASRRLQDYEAALKRDAASKSIRAGQAYGCSD